MKICLIIFIVIFALPTIALPIVAADRCPDYCRSDTHFYSGEYNPRSEQCDYITETCPNGCESDFCASMPAQEPESTQGVEIPSCDTYCKDGVLYTGIINGRECTYSRDRCDFGCDGDACARPPPKPQVRQAVVPPTCDTFCQGDYLFTDHFAGRNCEYDKKFCDFGCDPRALECFKPDKQNSIAFLKEEHENKSKELDMYNVSNKTVSVIDISQIPAPKKDSTINEKQGNKGTIKTKGIILTYKGLNVVANDDFIQIQKTNGPITIANNVDSAVKKHSKGREVKDVKLAEENDTPIYIITLVQEGKLFGVFNVNIPIIVYVDAKTLKEQRKKVPWWKRLVKIKEKILSCKTQTDCAKYEDGNLCTGVYYCVKEDNNPKHWTCKINPGSIPDCADFGEQCQINSCNPKTGMCEAKNLPETTLCNADNLECTKDDYCKAGDCVAGSWDYKNLDQCQCRTQDDCKSYENGNLCDGTLYCDNTNNKCKLNPSTIIKCSSFENTQCEQNTCNSKTGVCEMKQVNEGLTCDDGNKCTKEDICTDGLCKSGENICECEQNTDCQKFENGNLCDGTLYCDKNDNKCKLNPSTEINCQSVDDTQCLQNTCNPKTGACEKKQVNEGLACDNGNKCTKEDICTDGLCKSGENICECEQNTDCQKFENGNLCDGTLYCDKLDNKCKLNPSTKITCQTVDDTQCKQNTCSPKTGECKMKPVNIGSECKSPHPCIDAVCSDNGFCAGDWNFNKVIDENQKCQCKENSDCEQYEDGIACNGTLYCNKQKGSCVINPKTVTC